MHTICYGCSKYGHLAENCQSRRNTDQMGNKNLNVEETREKSNDQVLPKSLKAPATEKEAMGDKPMTSGTFGPWMVVAQRSRPNRGNNLNKNDSIPTKVDTNRFSKLDRLEVNGKNKDNGKGKIGTNPSTIPGANYVNAGPNKGGGARVQGPAKRRRSNDSNKMNGSGGPDKTGLREPSGPMFTKATNSNPLQLITNGQKAGPLFNKNKQTSLSTDRKSVV